MTRLRKRDSVTVLVLLLAACSPDTPPDGAFETRLQVAVVPGAFDPDRGQIMASRFFVVVDSITVPLVAAQGARIEGFDNRSGVELSGRNVIVAGELIDGLFVASYIEVLPEAAEPIDAQISREKEVAAREAEALRRVREEIRRRKEAERDWLIAKGQDEVLSPDELSKLRELERELAQWTPQPVND